MDKIPTMSFCTKFDSFGDSMNFIFFGRFLLAQTNWSQKGFPKIRFKNVENENFDFSLDLQKIAAPSKYNN